MSENQTAPTDASAAISSALATERLRNIRLVNRARVAILFVTLFVDLFFLATRPGHPGSVLLHSAWLVSAFGVALGSQRSDAFARRSASFVTFVDMPVFFLQMRSVFSALEQTAHAIDSRPISTGVTVYFALIILLSGMLLERRQLYLTLVLALVLLGCLQIEAGVYASNMAFAAVGLMATFGVAIATGNRTVALVTAVSDEQRRRERLGRYFSPQVAARLLDRHKDAGRGEIREVTVLFGDLRDFTAIGESMPGPSVVTLLNSVHEAMVEAIFANGGTLDKYMGDGIMAYFGAPMDQPDHAACALRCAAAMQTALGRLNERRALAGTPPLRMGIGVHSGGVVLGDIGAARRREYTVIGHTVNIAARLEQMTKETGVPVLISAETALRAGATSLLREVDTIAIRGQVEPMKVYTFAAP